MKKVVKTLVLIFGCISCLAQVTNVKSLIVAEFLKDQTGTGHFTYLVSYNFQEGKFLNKDTVFGAEMENDSIIWFHFRYDLGKNFIYQNRYIVSGTGNVVDIKTKSLVVNASDNFIEAHADTMLFYRSNIYGGTGYLVLDLKSRTYGFVKDTTFRAVKGFHSPDHKHGLEILESTIPRKIIFYDQNNQKDTIVQNAGYGTWMSSYSSSHGKVPFYWIDNSNFVYAEYSRPNYSSKTSCSVITIKKVNVKTRSTEVIGTLDSVRQAIMNSKFYFDEDSNLVFLCKKGFYKIDCANKKLEKYSHRTVVNGFEVRAGKDISIVIYNDKEIGEIYLGHFVTTNGYFACEYGEKQSNLAYPKGLKVWNNYTKDWITIDIPWECALIGWIEN